MREIKFSAWDKDECGMRSWENLQRIKYKNHEDNIFNDSDLILRQYIGKKDKNGVEIYEFDIVQKMIANYDDLPDEVENPEAADKWWDENSGKIPQKSGIVDVVTMNRFPVYWLENESFGYEGDDLEDPEDFEIIGNKFENPELLEE